VRSGGGDEVGGQLGIGVHGQDRVALMQLHQQRHDGVVERARLAIGVGGHHHHLDALVGEPSGDLLGPIARVVDDHHDPVRRLGLVQDRPDGGREARLFVSRWDHHRNAHASLLTAKGGYDRRADRWVETVWAVSGWLGQRVEVTSGPAGQVAAQRRGQLGGIGIGQDRTKRPASPCLRLRGS
jgi:hypothetical protein